MTDRTQAFDQLTDHYRRFRPGYPESVLEALREYLLAGERSSSTAWPDPWLLLDVGAGTGISTRTLRYLFGTGPRVAGVEPGSAMRETAATTGDSEAAGVEYVAGRAEEIPFADRSASLVLAAQAVHWFDRPAFYAEAARVLVPGGTVAVLNNDRDWTASGFVDAYESLMEEHGDDYRRDYRVYDTLGEMTAQDALLLADAAESTAIWVRELDRDGLIGMAQSSTKMAAVRRALGEERALATIAALVDEYFPDGDVRIPYVTRLFLARRA